VINFGDGGYGTLAAAATISLFDADGGRNTGDEIDFRARELLHKLASVEAHGIKKPPLSLGKKKIKRQSALARATNPGHHDKAIPRNAQRQIFQIVFARAMNLNGFARFNHIIPIVKHVGSVAQVEQHQARSFFRFDGGEKTSYKG
jgi:hypothetical protein